MVQRHQSLQQLGTSSLKLLQTPLVFKIAQNLDLRCVELSYPGTLGAGAKTRLESSITKEVNPILFLRLPSTTAVT